MRTCDVNEMLRNRFSRYVTLLVSPVITWVVSERRTISCMNECAVTDLSNLRLNVEEIGGGSLQSSEKDYVGLPAR